MANATGRVVQILGGVVDVEFPREDMPDLFEAIEVQRPGKEPMILEVQNHIGDNWVRTVAMDATDGLQRGMPARATDGRQWALTRHLNRHKHSLYFSWCDYCSQCCRGQVQIM